jgi:tRNA pseudouridine13 synthase
MKLKQQPEDFQVEELTDVVSFTVGTFAFYRLTKRGWTTPDALQIVRRRWRIEPRRISYGGLKDRHAHTVQYLTIAHGPRRGLKQQGITLEYLGQRSEPYTSSAILANRFHLTLRDLSDATIESALLALDEVRAFGVPNYFDDQRFGSVSAAGEFVAREMVLGEYEEALKLALTAAYEYDRAAQKKEKAILRRHWRDWPACATQLPRGQTRDLVGYLAQHPEDFRGALACLHPELRGFYLSAYQSALWNRLLARWLVAHLLPDQLVLVRLRLGEVPMHRRLEDNQRDQLAELRLPLPSARLSLPDDDPRDELVDSVLREEGIERDQLKLKGLRDFFFSKGERAGLCLPYDLQHEVVDDERHDKRKKLVLRFDLPRGCYATLLVKRITQ